MACPQGVRTVHLEATIFPISILYFLTLFLPCLCTSLFIHFIVFTLTYVDPLYALLNLTSRQKHRTVKKIKIMICTESHLSLTALCTVDFSLRSQGVERWQRLLTEGRI